ncbi:MAG: PAS domain S-box protein [Bacteroidia bacterium]|nr:PAS domain S-box protein [Bacteroidia bacterium]
MRELSFVLIFLVFLTALLALIGWQFHIEGFKRPFASKVAMNPLTALTFLLEVSAFVLLSRKQRPVWQNNLGKGLVATVFLFAILAISGAIWPSIFQVDRVLFHGELEMDDFEVNSSNGMAINTSLGFIIAGISVLLLARQEDRGAKIAHLLALFNLMAGILTFMGYFYHVPEFGKILNYLPMGVHTAICFVLISLAIFFNSSEKGFSKEFWDRRSGGQAGRVLFPLALIIPLVAGKIRLMMLDSGNISGETGTLMLVWFIIFVFLGLMIYMVIQLNHKEILREKSDSRFRALVKSAPDAMVMVGQNGIIQMANLRAEDLFGYTKEEMLGEKLEVLLPERFQSLHSMHRIGFFADPQMRAMGTGLELLGKRKDGHEFPVEVSLSPLETESGILVSAAIRDITERKEAEALLSHFNDELSRQVEQKTSQLEETTSQLRRLSARTNSVVEEERKSMARDIHDSLGQMLVGLRMDVVWLRKKVGEKGTTIDLRFERTLDLLNETRDAVRRISKNLHPVLLQDLGLVAAIKYQCTEFENSSGIKTVFKAETGENFQEEWISKVGIGFYRVFQESLSNVARHADATEIKVNLRLDGKILSLSITDNGKGFVWEETGKRKTLGLLSMRERALAMNGNFELNSQPGKGTTISLKVPVITD